MIDKKYAIVVSIILLLMNSCAHKNEVADMILHNAVIYSLDKDNRIFEAVAIKDGKILEIGAERKILNRYKSKNVIDLQRRTVYPGFIDAHCHFIQYGLTKQNLDLSSCRSMDEMIAKTKDHSHKNPGKWIVGSGWDDNLWEDGSRPNKRDLDSLFSDRPVFLKRVDLHVGLANQKALEELGYTLDTKIDGGEIEVVDGQLTGVLKDQAYNEMVKIIPPVSIDDQRRAILKSQYDCLEKGLTTVDDAALTDREVQLLQEMYESDDLKIRVYAMLMDEEVNYRKYLDQGPVNNGRLHIGAFKYFLDGALGSGGASLLESYSDDKENNGLILYTEKELLERAVILKENNWQMCAHAIGDNANRMILNVYDRVLGGENDLRWRVEHAQMVHPDDLEKFRINDIIPSIQPTHATSDMKWVVDKIGEERSNYSYAYKDLIEYSNLCAIGTDFPVEGINPINSFYSAVFRLPNNEFDLDPFQPENAISRIQALKGMTIWAAFSNREEKEKGSIEVGKFADLTILDRDILKVEKQFILDTEVIMTIIDGEIVFERD